jgi:hypothetical protein
MTHGRQLDAAHKCLACDTVDVVREGDTVRCCRCGYTYSASEWAAISIDGVVDDQVLKAAARMRGEDDDDDGAEEFMKAALARAEAAKKGALALPPLPSAPSMATADVRQFERAVAGRSRVVLGWTLFLLAATGFFAGVFGRAEAALRHEQWAYLGPWIFWTAIGVIVIAFGNTRGDRGRDPFREQAVRQAAYVRLPGPVLLALFAMMCLAAVDCGLARIGVHAVNHVHPPLVELRIDSDWGMVLFGSMALVVSKM